MDKDQIMDSKRIQDDEYELQYYGFSSTSFILEFKDLILTTIKEYVDDLEKITLESHPELVPLGKKEWSELFEEYKKITLDNVKAVEEDIRNYFGIPKNVLLPEDVGNVPCSKSVIKKLEEEIEELEEAYKAERTINFLFSKELEMLDSLLLLNEHVSKLIVKFKSSRKTKESNSQEAIQTFHNDLTKKLTLLGSKHKFILK